MTVSNSPEFRNTDLSSILKTETKTVGGSHLTDMPLSELIGVQPITSVGRVSVPFHG